MMDCTPEDSPPKTKSRILFICLSVFIFQDLTITGTSFASASSAMRRKNGDSSRLLRSLDDLPSSSLTLPSPAHERKRRRIERYLREASRLFNVHLRGMSEKLRKRVNASTSSPRRSDHELLKSLDHLRLTGDEQLLALEAEMDQFRDMDGQREWRAKETKELSAIVRARLDSSQNPAKCSTAKKLVCSKVYGAGFGSTINRYAWCFVLALTQGRTLLIDQDNFRFGRGSDDGEDGLESLFLPISRTCHSQGIAPNGRDMTQMPPYTGKNQDDLDVKIDARTRGPPSPRKAQFPLAVPLELRGRLERLHGNPAAWWIGQLVDYLMRPNEKLNGMMQDTTARLGYAHPVVGVHVRRTDKLIKEGGFHSLPEYMDRVDSWFRKYEISHPSFRERKRKRNVFLATDDPSLLEEAEKVYAPLGYNFISNHQSSLSAGVNPWRRNSKDSVRQIVVDTFLLAQSDFLVCTFSSNVGRLAFELMQAWHPTDASASVDSLDTIFHFSYQRPHKFVAIVGHEPSERRSGAKAKEIQLKKGDLINADVPEPHRSNLWNGFFYGRNERTRERGIFPAFKIEDRVDWVKFNVSFYHD